VPAKHASSIPHEISEERHNELRVEAARLIDSVNKLKAERLRFDDEPSSFLVALRARS
jgi:hypothetical protein